MLMLTLDHMFKYWPERKVTDDSISVTTAELARAMSVSTRLITRVTNSAAEKGLIWKKQTWNTNAFKKANIYGLNVNKVFLP